MFNVKAHAVVNNVDGLPEPLDHYHWWVIGADGSQVAAVDTPSADTASISVPSAGRFTLHMQAMGATKPLGAEVSVEFDAVSAPTTFTVAVPSSVVVDSVTAG